MRGRVVRWVGVVALAAAAAVAANGGVQFFRLQSRDALLEGTLEAVSIDALGTLRLADRPQRLGEIGEPFLFAAARHPRGWVVGTGNAGKVLLIDDDGGVETLFEAPETEIFAVWVDPDGTVFAGSSPGGRVYRIAGGEVEPFFDPGETYIWALARAADGSLLVATGTRGRLYRVDASGRGRVFFTADDTHVRSLEALPGGDLLLGTAGSGLVVRVDARGRGRTLHDAAQPEVVALAVGAGGVAYAALLASEASLADLARRDPAGGEDEEGEGEAAVTVTVTDEAAEQPPFSGSRPTGFRGPRSEVIRIDPGGRVETLWRFEEDTVYDLLWLRDRLWVGSGLDGKLYALEDGGLVLAADVDERQIVALTADDPGPAFATTNAAALYRLAVERDRRGTYTSPALDAGSVARFGTLRWRGVAPAAAALHFAARSGMSAEPDATWSAWTEPASGAEVDLGGLPAGRYLQWRAELTELASGAPELSSVTVSYRQDNLPPRITRLDVLEPGEILVPANFNPANQVFEPAHPNREGIFTTLDTRPPRADRRLKTLWKRGYRTLQWESEDPNEDELVYELSFRAGDGAWLPVADELTDSHYSFDATTLPDGVYRFRLRAADRAAGSLEPALRAEEVTEPVLVDHSPPRLGAVERVDDRLRVSLSDAWNPLREAVVSVDAGAWQPVAAADGLLDGQRETVWLDPPADGRLLLLRVTDAASNVATFDLSSAGG